MYNIVSHACTCAYMQCTGKRLPEWGFQQYEVVTDRVIQGTHVVWGMEELRLPNASEGAGPPGRDREEEERQIRKNLSKRLSHTHHQDQEEGGATLSFWEKYMELQVRFPLLYDCYNNSQLSQNS